MHPRKQQFIELFEESGWSQAEAARRLELSRGGMNGIIKGETVPSEGLLKLFQMTLYSEGKVSTFTDAPSAQAWAEDLLTDLRALPNKERDQLVKLFRQIAQLLPARRVSYSKSPVADLLHGAIDFAVKPSGDNRPGAKAPATPPQADPTEPGKVNPPGKTKP